VLARAPRWRILAGCTVEGQAGDRQVEAAWGGDAQVSRDLLVSSRFGYFPGESGGAILVSAGLFVGRGSWLGAFQVGPGPREVLAAVGVHLGSRLVWTVTYAGNLVEVGISWGIGMAELRASTGRHPFLGSRSSALLILGATER
jgi:hypothetical protein